MTHVQVPYGSTHIALDIEADVLDIGTGRGMRASIGPAEVIRQALRNPLGTKRLREILACNKNAGIVIVIDDHTRDTPTELMLDALSEELGEEYSGQVTLLVACGSHDPPSADDLIRILGKHVGKFPIMIHECDADDLIYVGTTSRGTVVRLNKSYVNADIRVLTGDITLHYYAGFGGGRKSILPGIAARETIKKNHALLVDAHARPGNIARNPVHLDMTEAASFAPPNFVLNVVEAGKGNIVAAYAGDMNVVFQKGIAVATNLFSLDTPAFYDTLVVSAGGFPKDQNLFQASKAIENCYRAVAPGGELILVAECREGIGDPNFEAWMDRYQTYEETAEAIRTNFELGGHKAYYMRKAMTRIGVSIVSDLNTETLTRWQLKAFKSLTDILDGLKKIKVKLVLLSTAWTPY